MKNLIVFAILVTSLGLGHGALAEGFSIKPDDSVQKILGDWKGKRVTIRLSDGTEITGKVRKVTDEVVEMGELSDHGYSGRTVELSKIAMLIVKPRDY